MIGHALRAAVRTLGAIHRRTANHASHVVQPGESLGSIAARYTGDPETWVQLRDANGLTSASRPGERLVLPAGEQEIVAGSGRRHGAAYRQNALSLPSETVRDGTSTNWMPHRAPRPARRRPARTGRLHRDSAPSLRRGRPRQPAGRPRRRRHRSLTHTPSRPRSSSSTATSRSPAIERRSDCLSRRTPEPWSAGARCTRRRRPAGSSNARGRSARRAHSCVSRRSAKGRGSRKPGSSSLAAWMCTPRRFHRGTDRLRPKWRRRPERQRRGSARRSRSRRSPVALTPRPAPAPTAERSATRARTTPSASAGRTWVERTTSPESRCPVLVQAREVTLFRHHVGAPSNQFSALLLHDHDRTIFPASNWFTWISCASIRLPPLAVPVNVVLLTSKRVLSEPHAHVRRGSVDDAAVPVGVCLQEQENRVAAVVAPAHEIA